MTPPPTESDQPYDQDAATRPEPLTPTMRALIVTLWVIALAAIIWAITAWL